MRTFRKMFIFMTIAVLAGLSLPVQAQGSTPRKVGLRWDAPPYALHGPFWVGTREFEAKTDSHPTKVALWYPALNTEAVEESVSYPFPYWPPDTLTITGHALLAATPNNTGAPYPLIIFAHGWEGDPYVAVYLCEHLASQGFVVMAIKYDDNYGTRGTVSFESTWFSRPKDVTWQLDYAQTLNAANGKLEGMLDMQRIAVVGWSLGGHTALMTAGARLDLSGLDNLCATYTDYRWMCQDIDKNGLARKAGLDSTPQGLWPSWNEPRVDAIVTLAPWVLGLSPKSLNELSVPALVLFGSDDRSVIPEFGFYKSLAYDSLGSNTKSLVVFENGTHFLPHNPCRDWPWRIRQYPAYECSEPVWDMDRAHDLINHFTTAFLLDVLKDDKEAHKSLLPDAVKFVGIQYQTTMK